MTGREAYQIWAPHGAKWTDWARPVPFIAADTLFEPCSVTEHTIPEIYYIDKAAKDTAVIVDLPGCGGVREGLALAKLGFRPVPLYNGTNEQPGVPALADNHSIGSALIWGASKLAQLDIADDALPAFLLDSNRLHIHRTDEAVFDNSWDIYEQDMPTAEYFLKNGIKKIIVRGILPEIKYSSICKDLRKIFKKYQKKGIEILYTDGYEPAEKYAIIE